LRRLTLRVGARDAGTRLDRFISAAGGISRGLARRTLDSGGVFLEGRRCKVAGRLVREGQAVVVNLGEAGRAPATPVALDRSRILYADEHLVAVDKPCFVPAQATLTSDRGALPELVAAVLGAPVTLVHRLDRETSGVCLLARTPAAATALSEAFHSGSPQKTYLALTAVAPVPPAGRVSAPLGPDPTRPGRRAVVTGGDAAATAYRTIASGPSGTALVECRPETGRTHQIRVHLAHLGAPLLGDARYGGPRRVLETSIPRVMLHARRLALAHPTTAAPLLLEAALPEDFVALLAALVPEAARAAGDLGPP
jgi:23S rRNA pseudouridine1911/1915/1917 synthase